MTYNSYKKGLVHHNYGEQKVTYEKLIRLIGGFKKDEKVFDAGCGSGFVGKYLGDKEIFLIGGDLNVADTDKLLGYSKVMKCDIEKRISLEDKEVDTVISVSVFQFLDDIDSALIECKRIAKKRIIINVPNSKPFRLMNFFRPWRIKGVKYLDTKILKGLGKKHGFKTRILYLSNKFDKFRKLWGDVLPGGIIAIYEID